MAAAKLSFKRHKETAAANKMASHGSAQDVFGTFYCLTKDEDDPDTAIPAVPEWMLDLLLCILIGLCLRVSSGVLKSLLGLPSMACQ